MVKAYFSGVTRNLLPKCMKYYSSRAGLSIWVAWVRGDGEGCVKIIVEKLCTYESELASVLLFFITGRNEN